MGKSKCTILIILYFLGNIEVTSSSGNIKCGSISGLLKAYTKDGDIEAKLTLGGNLDATTLNGKFCFKAVFNREDLYNMASTCKEILLAVH